MDDIKRELANQLWGGQLGGDANNKAREMMPWLKKQLAEAEQRGYERGIADAIKAVGEDEVSGHNFLTDPPWIPGAKERNKFRTKLRAKLESLRGGTIAKKDSTSG